MKIEIKILRYILVPIFGAWFLNSLIKSYQEDFFLEFISFGFISILGLISYGWTIYQDRKNYRKTKKITSFLPTILGGVVIIFISGYYLKKQSELNSPTLIKAFYDGGYNGVSLELKKNGNYIIANGCGLGQSYFYGSYTLQDSIITLDKNEINKVIVSKRLVIRPINQSYRDALNEFEYYIFQIDRYGKDLDLEVRFRITEDNR